MHRIQIRDFSNLPSLFAFQKFIFLETKKLSQPKEICFCVLLKFSIEAGLAKFFSTFSTASQQTNQKMMGNNFAFFVFGI